MIAIMAMKLNKRLSPVNGGVSFKEAANRLGIALGMRRGTPSSADCSVSAMHECRCQREEQYPRPLRIISPIEVILKQVIAQNSEEDLSSDPLGLRVT